MSDVEQLINSKDFNIRYTTVVDDPFLREWLNSDKILKWFSMSDAAEVEEMVKIWMGYSRFKCSLTATYKEIPCGIATLFLMPYTKLIHQSMVYLVVDPKFHRQKIGTALVKNLDHLASTYFRLERMHYEIFGQNPLEQLLLKQGYIKLLTQEHYVKEEEGYLSRTILEKVFKA